MRAIAFGRVTGTFALAIMSRFRDFGFKDHRCELSSFVLAVAKWLVFRQATSAVGVFFSSFDFDLFGKTCSDFWLVHFVSVQIYDSLIQLKTSIL